MQHGMMLHPPAAHRGLAMPRTRQCISALLHSGSPRSAAASGPSAAPQPHRPHLQTRGRAHTVVVRAENDYYDLLGVPKTADKKTLKQAYRQKARKYHPDVNKEPGAEELFKRIGEAYEVLSDDNKRAIYDRYGEAALKGGGMGGPGGMGGMGGVEFSNPFDLFEQFFSGGSGGFGGMRQGQRSQANAPGEDEKHDLQLDFLDAVFGCAREIDIDKMASCKACDSTGVLSGTTPSSCPQCQGSGQVFSALRTPLGTFQQVSSCPRCEGEGQIFTACDKCNGMGRVRESKRISLKIPPGVDSGSRLRVRGEGSAGRRSAEPGDLYVYITVKEHPEGLRRDGTTIHSDVEIPFVDAILGSQVKVTTVDGPVELKIPAGTQPGTTLLMSKRGVPRLGNPTLRGDHMVHVRVKIPKTLSSDERKLVEELKELQSQPKAGPFRF